MRSVHTHSAAAVALSLLRDDVPLVHYQTAVLGGRIAVAEYAPFGTDELAANVSAALTGRRAAVGSQARRSPAADRAAPPAVRLPASAREHGVTPVVAGIVIAGRIGTASSGLVGFRRPRRDTGRGRPR